MTSIDTISQGTKFIYNDNIYMKLPNHVECYGNKSNAIDILTGTMVYINDNTVVNVLEFN